MRSHWKYKIDYIGFPDTHRKVAGVYMIGTFYVGASKHIRNRILSHCSNAINNSKGNIGLTLYLKDKILKNEPIELMLLDEDIYKEGEYIINFKPLYNQTTISYSNKKLR